MAQSRPFEAKRHAIDIGTYNPPYHPNPDLRQSLPEDSTVALGDLHGSALKLIEFLYYNHILDLSKEAYGQLFEIYKYFKENTQNIINEIHSKTLSDTKKTELKNKISQFKDLIASAKVNKGPGIRLIGDVLADRGTNDYFTMLILKKLMDEKIPLEEYLSNHTIEALQAFRKFIANLDIQTPLTRLLTLRFAGQAASLLNLAHFIDAGLIERKEVVGMYHQYKKHIKLVGYYLDQTTKPNTFYIYRHGVVENTQKNIKALAEHFKIAYKAGNIQEFIETIDAINDYFLKNYDEILEKFKNETDDKREPEVYDNPLFQLIWGRYETWYKYQYKYGIKYEAHYEAERIIKFEDGIEIWQVQVHGHDSVGKVYARGEEINGCEQYIVNIDSDFRKHAPFHGYDELNSGTLDYYAAPGKLPSLELSEKATVMDLSLLLDKLPENDRADFLISLRNERLMTIILNGYQLSVVLNKLNENQRVDFLTTLSSEFLKLIIQNWVQLHFVLSILPKKQQTVFLMKLGVASLKTLIKTRDLLNLVLEKLPENKRADLLTTLGDTFFKTNIQNGYQLGNILRILSESQKADFLTSLSRELLINIIQDGYQLGNILRILSENRRVDFLKRLDDAFLKAAIKDGHQLINILCALSEEHQTIFLIQLGITPLKTIIQHRDQLNLVLEKFPENQRADLLIALGDECLKNIIVDDYQLSAALEKLPEIQRGAFLTTLSSEFLRSIIQDGYQLDDVLRILPVNQRANFIMRLGNTFLNVIIQHNLKNVLSLFDQVTFESEEKKLAIRAMILDEVLKTTSIDLLEIAYRHPYFSRHRDDTETREKINTFASKFFTEKSILETASQKQIMRRMNKLKSEKEVKSEVKKK